MLQEHRERTDEFFRESKSTGGLLKRGMRGRIYVRVSDTRNREETLISPEVQIGHCVDWAKREGIDLVAEPVVDLNLSGKSFAKRSVHKMIAEVKDGQYEVIIVWKWSRWGRNLHDSTINMALLDEVGGTLIAATEPVDVTTPTGVFSRTQFLAMAQLQLDQIRESWRDAHRTRLRNGLPHCGTVPYGYDYDKDERDPAKKYTANPEEFPRLQEMFRLYLAGVSPRTIAHQFNARGWRARKGGPFRPSTVRDTLDSGFGAGRIRYGEFEAFSDLWPHAVTREEWEQFLRTRKQRGSDLPPRTASQKALGKGMVHCGDCGRRMSLQRVKSKKGGKVYEYAFYRCNGPVNLYCKGVSVRESTVDSTLKSWLTTMVKGGEDAPEMQARKMRAEKAETDVKGIEKQIAVVKAHMKKATALIIEGVLTKDDYAEQKAAYEAELLALQEGLQSARADAAANFLPPADVFGALLLAMEAQMDLDGINHALRAVVRKVVVDRAQKSQTSASRLRVVPLWGDEPPRLSAVS